MLLEARSVACVFVDPLSMTPMSFEVVGLKTMTESQALPCAEPPLRYQAKTAAGDPVYLDGDTVDSAHYLIWFRNKRTVYQEATKKDMWDQFAIKEVTRFFYGMVHTYDLEGFNAPLSLTKADHKLHQLRVAQKVGLTVPDTLISSNPADIRSFVASVPKAIIKPLHTNFMEASIDKSEEMLNLFVNNVTMEELDQASDESLAIAPAIYQAEVEKDHELRIVATRTSLIAYTIYSQVTEAGRLDWRRSQQELDARDDYEIVDIPGPVRDAIFAYVQTMGLHYGVFDFVVGTDDYYYFLECNSDGQWGWLEKDPATKATQPISHMLADMIYHLLAE